MNMFSSGWLQRMADKSGTTPASRLQGMFRILQDWADVPGIREQFQHAAADKAAQNALKAYLLQLVQASGASDPELLGMQLHMILLGAVNEEMREPGGHAFEHAGKAALLLLDAEKPARRLAPGHMAMAASVMLAAGLTALFMVRQPPEIMTQPVRMAGVVPASTSPDRISSLYHLHQRVHAASCSYPQALMLAPEERAPFLENVIDGNVSKLPPESMMMVKQLYQKVDCYYPPKAMLL